MTMSDYILYDPKKDYIFKSIFGIEENKDLLISLINSILNDNPHIVNVKLYNTDIPKILEQDKSARLDIYAISDEGIRFNIEMQCKYKPDTMDRALFYTSKLFCAGMAEGNKYESARVISIWIFDENVTDRKEPISEAVMTFKKNGKDPVDVLSDSIRIIFLELRKYKVTNENLGNMLTTWVQFLKKPSNIKTNKVNDKCLDKAMKRLNYISTDDDERAMIDSIEAGRRESNTTLYKAEQKGLKKGLKQGKEEGLKQGKEEGLKQGKEEGLKQGKEEMAKMLLQSGVDINIISQSSGLTIEEIQKLTKK